MPQSRTFRQGDRVIFQSEDGPIPGIIITFYDHTNVLLYTDKEVGWAPMHMGMMQTRVRNICLLALRNQFGENLEERPVFKQKRFMCVPLSGLRSYFMSLPKKLTLDKMHNRRRCLFTMAYHHLRTNNEEGIQRACQNIEDLQKDIEENHCW